MSKRPPSPSGVALYAEVFEDVLASIGEVRRVQSPSDPRGSQTLRAAIRGFVLGWQQARSGADLVHVELSGRALFEFYFCLAFVGRSSRSQALAVTLHDAPSLAGAVALFGCLDRRGTRRLGLWLSRVAGRRWERRVMDRADAVFALTSAGADHLSRVYGRGVWHLPHVVRLSATQDSQPNVVFVPGYVDDVDRILAVLRALKGAGSESGRRWHLVIGSCSATVKSEILTRASGPASVDVSFLGHVDEDTLLEQYLLSTIVVRIVRGPTANSLAASGPISWAVAAGAAVVTNDRRAGATELAERGAICQCDDVAGALETMIATPARIQELRSAARLTATTMTADAVARTYLDALGLRR